MTAVKWDAVTNTNDTVTYSEWNLMRDRIKSFVIVGTTSDCDYVCDGTADDVEINAAIAYAIAHNGLVHIKSGTYNIDASIVVNGHCTIIGDGSEYTKLLAKNSFNSYIVQVNSTKSVNQYRVCFEHIKFSGNMANQSSGGGVIMYGAIQSSFRKCHWENCYNEGLYIYDTGGGSGSYGHHNQVIDCLFDQGESSGGLGIGLYMRNCDENTIIASQFQYNKIGIKDQTGFNQIVGCAFVDGEIGVYILDASRTRVADCVFDYCSHEGLYLKGAFNTVANNTFYRCSDGSATYACLRIEWYGCNTINSNTFIAQDTSNKTKYAIQENGDNSEDTKGLNCITGNICISMGAGATDLATTNWATSAIVEAQTNKKSNNGTITSAGWTDL